jgi:hypothetical protein
VKLKSSMNPGFSIKQWIEQLSVMMAVRIFIFSFIALQLFMIWITVRIIYLVTVKLNLFRISSGQSFPIDGVRCFPGV